MSWRVCVLVPGECVSEPVLGLGGRARIMDTAISWLSPFPVGTSGSWPSLFFTM